jgi:hypothetical protein
MNTNQELSIPMDNSLTTSVPDNILSTPGSTELEILTARRDQCLSLVMSMCQAMTLTMNDDTLDQAEAMAVSAMGELQDILRDPVVQDKLQDRLPVIDDRVSEVVVSEVDTELEQEMEEYERELALALVSNK